MATDLIARGLAAKTRAAPRDNTSTIAVSSYYLPEHGANLRPAYQAAINAAAAVNGRVINDYGAVTQQVWEKAYDTPAVFDVASINRNRTLTISACNSIDIDFAGANIVIKGPTGGDRFASGGQTAPASPLRDSALRHGTANGCRGFWSSSGSSSTCGLPTSMSMADLPATPWNRTM